MTTKQNFETKEQAIEWMLTQFTDPTDCTDNIRFAMLDDSKAMHRYEQQTFDGCCGTFDADITINGNPAVIGCNYGH